MNKSNRPCGLGVWRWLENEHPVAANAVWGIVMGIQVFAIVISVLCIAARLR